MKNLYVKIAAQNLFSLQVNKNSMRKKVWLTSQKDVRNAEKLAETTTEEKEKCMMLFVLNAVRKLKFHSNLFQEKKSIAKIALQKNTKHKINSKITKQTGLIIKPVCFYLYPNTTV